MADQARGPSDTLLGDVRALGLAQTTRSSARANDLRRQAANRRSVLWGLFLASLLVGAVTSFCTVRSVDRPLSRLIGAAERFGAGDLRPIQLGAAMPTEIERLGRAMDDMGGRLRGRRASRWSAKPVRSATARATSRAMSEELAASSGEISTAMVKIAASAEQQVSGMEKADALLRACARSRRPTPQASARVAQLGDRIQELAARHRSDVAAAGQTLLDVREVVRTSAGQVQELARSSEPITGVHRSHQADLVADQPARPQRRHRGRPRRRARPRLRRGSGRGPPAGRLQRHRGRGRGQDGALHPEAGARCVGTMEVGSAKVQGIEAVATAAARALEDISRGGAGGP